MTIEQLEARKQELINQQNQFIANTHALSGAIQDCDFWLSQLKARDEAQKERAS